MTRERAAELIPIIQAYADGKEVQVHDCAGWIDASSPTFDDLCSWRIRPEPREWWIVPNTAVKWSAAFNTKEDAENTGTTKSIIHVREIDL